ncbi:MAG: hypothetical protein Kilf2KO_34250 [Rhodospirillales bacterium]
MPDTISKTDLLRLSTPELLALRRQLTLDIAGLERGTQRVRQIQATLTMISQVLSLRRLPKASGP